MYSSSNSQYCSESIIMLSNFWSTNRAPATQSEIKLQCLQSTVFERLWVGISNGSSGLSARFVKTRLVGGSGSSNDEPEQGFKSIHEPSRTRLVEPTSGLWASSSKNVQNIQFTKKKKFKN